MPKQSEKQNSKAKFFILQNIEIKDSLIFNFYLTEFIFAGVLGLSFKNKRHNGTEIDIKMAEYNR